MRCHFENRGFVVNRFSLDHFRVHFHVRCLWSQLKLTHLPLIYRNSSVDVLGDYEMVEKSSVMGDGYGNSRRS